MREPTDRSRVRRLPARASYDSAAVHAIIDASPLCHIAFVVEDQPYIVPTNFARIGEDIVIHGSPASRLIQVASSGAQVTLSFTLLDGVVLARSAFHHSVNYRSAIVFGRGRAVDDPVEKMAALQAIVNHLLPGRWDEVRAPSEAELKATAVGAIRIEEASAKRRTGPPVDDRRDLGLPIWAGVVPVSVAWGEPERAADVPSETLLPSALRHEEVG